MKIIINLIKTIQIMTSKVKRIVVTGGSGFIGNHICKMIAACHPKIEVISLCIESAHEQKKKDEENKKEADKKAEETKKEADKQVEEKNKDADKKAEASKKEAD